MKSLVVQYTVLILINESNLDEKDFIGQILLIIDVDVLTIESESLRSLVKLKKLYDLGVR